jgi:hypothetical protein
MKPQRARRDIYPRSFPEEESHQVEGGRQITRAGDRGRWIQRRARDRGLLSKCQTWYTPEPGHTRQQAACNSICDPKALTYSANTSWATSSRPTSGFFTKAASAACGECSNDARTVKRSYSFTCNSNERAASGAWPTGGTCTPPEDTRRGSSTASLGSRSSSELGLRTVSGIKTGRSDCRACNASTAIRS